MSNLMYRTTTGTWWERETWLKLILSGHNKPKPPMWWLEHKLKVDGRTHETSYAIWHRNYKADRRYVIWDQASDEDFRAAGYL